MNVHFFRPGNNSDSILELEDMFRAPGVLYVAVAYFNSMRFADLIIERATTENHTKLLVNTSDILRPQKDGNTEIAISKALMTVLKEGYSNKFIQTKSLGIRIPNKYQNMHHKFMVNEDYVAFGSVNLTDAAINRNFESLVKTEDELIRNRFINEFNELWKEASDIYSDNDGGIRSIMCPSCERSESVDFESYGPFCINCGFKFKVE